jgi:spore coat protein A, manganese oxidase
VTPALSLPAPAGPPLHPDALARFVDVLPIPRVLAPEGERSDPHDGGRSIPLYRVVMRETEMKIHRDVPATRFWSYGGSVPGPTFETRSGRGLFVEWRNELPAKHFLPVDHSLCGAGTDVPEVRAVVHVHGAKAPPESDGYPTEWKRPGESMLFHYPNQQDAAMLWYHDHAMGIERLNHYAGMFGVFFVRDAVEDALPLPGGEREIPLVLCDRMFGQDGQLRYSTSISPASPWVPEIYCDAMLVNGKLFPFLDVAAAPYRLRVVNASNARFFYLSLSDGQPFVQIGSDQGLLPAPATMRTVTLAPAERADLIVDFSAAAGQTVLLKSQAMELMQFRVGRRAEARPARLPAKLRHVTRLPVAAAKTRTLTLNEYEEPGTHRMLMLLDAKRWRDPVTETPVLDSVEVWRFVNLTGDTHPIHLHLVRFQILDRQPFDADEFLTSGKLLLQGEAVPAFPNETGWKDTVRADAGMITRIVVKFEGFVGRYVWHCHVLEHAANEMMRPFQVLARDS